MLQLFVEHEGTAAIAQFFILTVIMGGGAAFMAGRALASGWKPIWLLLAYMIPFTAGLRFMQFALFENTLTSLSHFITHGIVLTAFALFGYRTYRTTQMTSQYPWLYEKVSPWSWKSKN